MRDESYHDVARAFDWAKVHEDLGWAGREMVSLGTAIVDRHAAGERVALIWVGRDGTVRQLQVDGGFAQMQNNRLTLLCEKATEAAAA